MQARLMPSCLVRVYVCVSVRLSRSWILSKRINNKTKKNIFHRPASRHLNIPPPMPDIERVTRPTLLGIDITSTLSTAAYVIRMLLQKNQRLYLLSVTAQVARHGCSGPTSVIYWSYHV